MLFPQDPDALGGYDSDAPLPSVSELKQCELEVGALLKIIAELNTKMGSLQAPRYTRLSFGCLSTMYSNPACHQILKSTIETNISESAHFQLFRDG